jgi:hypothetical protein
MIQSLIKFLLARLAGITAQQWNAAILWVLNTARAYKDSSGSDKKERVLTVLKKQFPELDTESDRWKLDTLIQFAFAWLRKEGKA